MCVDILPACMSVHYRCTWCLQRPDEGINPETGITGGCESPFRESNSGPLGRVARVLNHYTISPDPLKLILTTR